MLVGHLLDKAMEDNRMFYDRKVLSSAEKNANDKQWYKDRIQSLDIGSTRSANNTRNASEYRRMKTNYDLFNNILDLSDFEYVCKPFGHEVGELPAKMVNRDILSNKIKVILGLESQRPFEYGVIALNPEATTRKEQKEADLLKEYTINSIIQPIRKQLEMQAAQQSQGRELTAQEKEQISKQIEEQLKAMTPEEVKVYMQRDHQDPAEAQSAQLLEYLRIKDNLERKFNIGTKHAAISAKEFYWVGEVNGEPTVRVCNPTRANYDKSPETEYVEDGEWFTYEYRMTPSQVIAFFADELTKSEIQQIYNEYKSYITKPVTDDLFNFSQYPYYEEDRDTMRVLHATWRALREIKFLTYKDEEGEIRKTIVDDNYRFNPEAGDIEIYSEVLPEIYEGYKIGTSIYKKMRPVPGQFKDMDNLYYAPLPYHGAVYDADNSVPTSLMDRGKVWQYYLNIVYYRLEMVLASDKGKKVLMNINAIPDSAGIDIQKFKYFFESSPFGWYDPNGEGVGYQDVNTVAKVLDLSTASDIAKYVELIDKIKRECGDAMGISPQMEAQIAQREAVQNTQHVLYQNSLMLEPFFSLHDLVKRKVLQALIDTAKVCYAKNKPVKLSYMMDDMTTRYLDLDVNLLDNSTIGIFINNATDSLKVKETIAQLSQAALQAQQATFKDVISIMKQTSISEAENILTKSQRDAQDRAMQAEQMKQDNLKEIENMKEANLQRQHEREKELIVLKESERRQTELAKVSIQGYSFNPDQDTDNDGKNDFLEVAQSQTKMNIDIRKQNLDEAKFLHQRDVDKKSLELKKEEIQVKKTKSTSSQK